MGPRGVNCAGRNVASVTHTVRVRFAAHRKRHLAIENKVRREARVRVIGIVGVRAILPDVSVRKALRFELFAKLAVVWCGHHREEL